MGMSSGKRTKSARPLLIMCCGILGNWQLSFLVSAHTGFPFTPTTGTDASLTGVGQDRPNVVGSPYVRNTSNLVWLSATAFAPWTEMTLKLQPPVGGAKVHCSGVVISCTGSRHTGYHVSMVFTGLSKQSQARLAQMAQTA